MKKNYLQPEIEVVTIHHESPLLTDSEYMEIYDHKRNKDKDNTVDEFDDLL